MVQENYEKFIALSTETTTNEETGDSLYCYTLEGLARIVDVAFNEGRIKELIDDESYSEDATKIDKLATFERQIEHAFGNQMQHEE